MDTPCPSLLDLAAGARPLDWLWPGWIPRAALTLFAASPGAGKSLVALDLARRLIAGLPFPDGAPSPGPASVLLVDAEGPLPLLDARARAWDLDRSRLFLFQPKGHSLFDLPSPAQRKLLSRMVHELNPALLIVDSLGAALPGGEAGRKPLHALLTYLPGLASLGNLAVLVIHHLRKRTYAGLSPAAPVTHHDLRGSSHIAATARSILALGEAPAFGASPVRRLAVVKSNLCALPPPLGLVLEGGAAGAPTLRYTGPLLPEPPPPSQLDLCAAWLLETLAAAGQPLRPADLLRAAAELGFSQPTLYRARRALGPRILDLGSALHDPARRWGLAPPPASP